MICGMKRRSSRRSILILAATITACGSSAKPIDLLPPTHPPAGRYDLIAYEAKPLPDTLRVIAGVSSTPGTGSVTCPEILLGTTLDVAADGSFTRTSQFAYPCTGTLPRPIDLPPSYTTVTTGNVEILGSVVTLEYPSTSAPDTTNAFSDTIESGAMQGTDIVIGQVVTTATNSTETLPNARVYRHE